MQKTAYEMRISDWSSDVCSSDLAMREGGGGVILNFGSISWHLALPDLVLYQTAKAAISGLTRSLARDLGRDNIRVNTIVPGNVKTPRQEKCDRTSVV